MVYAFSLGTYQSDETTVSPGLTVCVSGLVCQDPSVQSNTPEAITIFQWRVQVMELQGATTVENRILIALVPPGQDGLDEGAVSFRGLSSKPPSGSVRSHQSGRCGWDNPRRVQHGDSTILWVRVHGICSHVHHSQSRDGNMTHQSGVAEQWPRLKARSQPAQVGEGQAGAQLSQLPEGSFAITHGSTADANTQLIAIRNMVTNRSGWWRCMKKRKCQF